MVSAIENLADLSGTVSEVRPHPRDEFVLLVLRVDGAADVEGFPNLLRQAQGQELAVTVERAAVEARRLAPGDAVVCRARRAAPTVVVAAPDGLSRPLSS